MNYPADLYNYASFTNSLNGKLGKALRDIADLTAIYVHVHLPELTVERCLEIIRDIDRIASEALE